MQYLRADSTLKNALLLYTVHLRVTYLVFVSLNSIKRLAFVMLMKCVFREVGDKLLNAVYSDFRIRSIMILSRRVGLVLC